MNGVPGVLPRSKSHRQLRYAVLPGSRPTRRPTESYSAIEEQRLLDRIGLCDRKAYWALWQLHAGYLFATCLRLTHGNRDDAQDILSEVCLRLAEDMPRYAGGIRNVRSWFARSLANAVVDHYRNYHRHVQSVGSAEDVAVSADAISPDRASPEEELITRQSYAATLQRFENLPRRLWIVASMRFFEDKSYAEIAQSLGITEALVRKRIQEARVILRKSPQSPLP